MAIRRPNRMPSTSSWTARTVPPPGIAAAVGESDDHRLAAPLVHGDRPGVLAGELHALGKVIGLQGDDVLPRAGEVHLPSTVPVGRDGVDLVALRRLHDDPDALHGPAAAGLHGAGHLLALGLGGTRGEGAEPEREECDQQQAQRGAPTEGSTTFRGCGRGIGRSRSSAMSSETVSRVRHSTSPDR
jgi:hypothetical protein